VDELNKQKESVGAHLAQISQLLGASMPGLVDVLQSTPPQPAVAPPAAKAVTVGPAAMAPPGPDFDDDDDDPVTHEAPGISDAPG
jgi:hypothetical protein